MSKNIAKKILSLGLCAVIVSVNIVYADTVIIGVAPNSSEKSLSQNASTTYLQNQYDIEERDHAERITPKEALEHEYFTENSTAIRAKAALANGNK